MKRRCCSESVLDAQLRKAKVNLGGEWSYDAVNEIFRKLAVRIPVNYNPFTNQYHSGSVFYDYNKDTKTYVKVKERKSKRDVYVQNFKRSLKEFLEYFSKSGLPKSQLMKSVMRLLARAENLYQKTHLETPPSGKLKNVVDELFEESTGGYSDTFGKKLLVDPPYTCPLCGRTTSNADTLFAHVKLHEYCTKRGLLPANAVKDENKNVERLLHSEALSVVGTKEVQKAVEISFNKGGRNNKKRSQTFLLMNNWLGIDASEDFSCDVIHAVRAAFPEAHGCYSGGHNCATFEENKPENNWE